MSEPYVKLARRFFRHWLWTERRELSRAEAFIDMITSATYEDEANFVEGGCLITLLRGEMRASVRELGTRWGWSRSRVERFFLLLKEERMIDTRTSAGLNIVKLLQYEIYNPKRDRDGPQGDAPLRQSRDNGETPPDGFPSLSSSFPFSVEKKEKRESARDAEIPTLEEVVAYGSGPAAIPADFCKHFFEVTTENNSWINQWGKLIQWRLKITRWWSNDRMSWKKTKVDDAGKTAWKHPTRGFYEFGTNRFLGTSLPRDYTEVPKPSPNGTHL